MLLNDKNQELVKLERRDHITRAAARVFLEHGFDRASMAEIARRADVSKQTLYSHFGSKESLFGEAINKACREHTARELLASEDVDFRTALHRLGTGLCSLLFSDDAIRLESLCVAGASSHPEVSNMYWEAGPVWIKQQLAEFFQKQIELGRLKSVDPNKLARQFTALLCGESRLKNLLGIAHADAATIEAVVTEAVDMMVDAYAL